MKIVLSIIVPVYNVKEYLVQCIESILKQTFSEFEVILVDDGSTDGSEKICDEYSAREERVRVIHQTNQGLSAARNIGIEMAKGQYIGFVDSDDWVHEGMYEALYDLAQLHDADIVQCEFERKQRARRSSGRVEILNALEALNYGYTHPKAKISMVVAWNKIYKRELFNEISYPIGKINEDEFTTYKLLYKASKIVLIHRVLYYYRRRSTSIMGQTFNIRRYDAIEAIGEKLEFARDIDRQLYLWVIKEYAQLLLEMFMRTKKMIPNNSGYLNSISMKYKVIFSEVIHNPYVNWLEKIKYILFRWMPNICTKVLGEKRREKPIDTRRLEE